MKVTIDEKICLKHNMTLSEVLLALAFRSMQNNDVHNMLQREIIVRKNNQYLVTQHWSEVLDEILCDSQGNVKTDEEFAALVKKMREAYPAGKVPGSPYLYRGNPKEIMVKLKKFFITYGNYSDDDIIDAVRRYVATFNGDYRYLKTLKYFISKNEKETGEDGETHIVEHSYLADYLENKENEEGVVTNNDWTTKMI